MLSQSVSASMSWIQVIYYLHEIRINSINIDYDFWSRLHKKKIPASISMYQYLKKTYSISTIYDPYMTHIWTIYEPYINHILTIQSKSKLHQSPVLSGVNSTKLGSARESREMRFFRALDELLAIEPCFVRTSNIYWSMIM